METQTETGFEERLIEVITSPRAEGSGFRAWCMLDPQQVPSVDTIGRTWRVIEGT